MYKRHISLSLATFLLVSLGGCNQAPQSTSSTSTLPFTPTSSTSAQDTATPRLEARAPLAIPGWSKFEGNQVELQLPQTFKGGDLAKDVEVFTAELRKLGPDFEPILQTIQRNPNAFALWAFDSEVGPSGNLTNVNIVSESVPSAITLDTYLDAAKRQFPPQFNVIEQEIIQLDRYTAGRLTTEFNLNGVKGKQLAYVIKQDTTVWVVTYSTGQDEFNQRVSRFETSIDTFYIQS